MKDLYDKAVRHFEAGELSEAESALLIYLKENPSDARAHNQLGMILLKKDNYDEAKRCFEEALRYESRLVQALNSLGNIAYNKGQYEQAINYYQKAVIIDPDYSSPHNNLAVVYKQLNRYGDFVREIRKAKRLETKKILQADKSPIREGIMRLWSRIRK